MSAILVQLRISKWEKVQNKELNRTCTKVRAFHFANTLHWDDTGFRLLPLKNYTYYMAKVTGFFDTFRHKADAISLDHPEEKNLRDKFSVNLNFYPIPSSEHMPINADVRLLDGIDIRAVLCIENAQAELWNRLAERLRHISEVLSGGWNFRGSLLTELRDECTAIGRMNFMEDNALLDFAGNVGIIFGCLDPADIRLETKLQERVAELANTYYMACLNRGEKNE